MSHFTVLCFGPDVKGQLAKYDENISVPEYNRGQVSDEDKQRMVEYYQRNEGFVGTFDECYEKFGESWNGNAYRKDENGVWCEYSTYNPDSKWDWYQVGGRWAGFFKLKPGAKGEVGASGAFNNKPEEGGADVLMKKDIDFEAMMDESGKEAEEIYDLAIKTIGHLPKIKSWETMVELSGENYANARKEYNAQPAILAFNEEKKLRGYSPEEFYISKEEYVENARLCSFIPYAIVKDGVWYQKGKMGWWGMSSGDMPQSEWNKKVKEMIDELPDDTIFTLIDAHI